MAAWNIPNLLYRSITAGVRPPSLLAGQLFINQLDRVLCWPDGAANAVKVSDLAPQLGVSQVVLAPASGKVSYGLSSLAKRELLAMQGSATSLTPLQPLTGFTRTSIWSASGNSAAPFLGDASAFTTLGTATPRAVASTNTLTRMRRLGYVSAATAGSLAYAVVTTANFLIGNGSDPSGFLAIFTFGCSDAATVAGARQFVGMSSSVAGATNVEPATLTNAIGIGHGAADTNLMLYCSGSTAQTAVNLGVNFPANTLSADAYRFTLWAAKDGSLNWQVDRVGTSFTATGTFANATPGTTAPANTTALAPRLWRTNNATALAVAFDMASVVIQTDGY
jgi:hypothetical protein